LKSLRGLEGWKAPKTENRKLKTSMANGQWSIGNRYWVIDAGAGRFVLRSKHVLIAVGVVDRDKLATLTPVNIGS